jgi:hypothetical protein
MFLPKTRQIASDLRSARAWAETPIPYEFESQTGIEDFEELGNDRFRGVSIAEGARLILKLPAKSAYTSCRITFEVSVERAFLSVAAAITDEGFDQASIQRHRGIPGVNSMQFALKSTNGRPIRKIFLRPSNQIGAFEMSDLKVVGPR